MEVLLRILKWSSLVFGILIIGLLTILYTVFPKVDPAGDIIIDSSDEIIARGDYLANHVAVCIDCHSTRDWSYFSGPIIPGTEGIGGEKFGKEYGFPGTFYAKNITPAGIGDWTDGELHRLITTGVTRDWEPIFPLMPYPSYGKMDVEDMKSIIAYIRSLEPQENEVKESKADFPMNLIMRMIPKPAEPTTRPSPSDTLNYGKYLVTIAGCSECHTMAEKGKPVEGMSFAGGFEFKLPGGGIVRSANLTPDETTGVGNWEVDDFLDRFSAFIDPFGIETVPGGFNTVMPWTMYAGMTEEDLTAIFKYLQTLTPIENEVIVFSQ